MVGVPSLDVAQTVISDVRHFRHLLPHLPRYRLLIFDLETKRKALERVGPLAEASESAVAAWRTDISVLDWLETL